MRCISLRFAVFVLFCLAVVWFNSGPPALAHTIQETPHEIQIRDQRSGVGEAVEQRIGVIDRWIGAVLQLLGALALLQRDEAPHIECADSMEPPAGWARRQRPRKFGLRQTDPGSHGLQERLRKGAVGLRSDFTRHS